MELLDLFLLTSVIGRSYGNSPTAGEENHKVNSTQLSCMLIWLELDRSSFVWYLCQKQWMELIPTWTRILMCCYTLLCTADTFVIPSFHSLHPNNLLQPVWLSVKLPDNSKIDWGSTHRFHCSLEIWRKYSSKYNVIVLFYTNFHDLTLISLPNSLRTTACNWNYFCFGRQIKGYMTFRQRLLFFSLPGDQWNLFKTAK